MSQYGLTCFANEVKRNTSNEIRKVGPPEQRCTLVIEFNNVQRLLLRKGSAKGNKYL